MHEYHKNLITVHAFMWGEGGEREDHKFTSLSLRLYHSEPQPCDTSAWLMQREETRQPSTLHEILLSGVAITGRIQCHVAAFNATPINSKQPTRLTSS